MGELAQVLSLIDAPTVVLLLMTAFFVAAAVRLQVKGTIDWTDAFRDEISNKVSSVKFAVPFALFLSGWILIYAFMNGMRVRDSADDLVNVLECLFKYFALFLAVWAMGPRFVEKVADTILSRWSGRSISTSQTVTDGEKSITTGRVEATGAPAASPGT